MRDIRGLICLCLDGHISVMSLSYCIFSGALGISDLLLSYFVTTVILHNTIILIITHLFIYQHRNYLV